jgi:hypothetical protein
MIKTRENRGVIFVFTEFEDIKLYLATSLITEDGLSGHWLY